VIVLARSDRPVLVDREALTMLTQRSVHTIRARCVVVRYRSGRPLYDLEREVARLSGIPVRRRDAVQEAS
jgi:hypothetical protein